jgi:hypothetical protein
MRQSESINALAAALASAQGEIEAAAKDRMNPHFKSRYATLAAAVEASRPALAKHGLAVIQSPTLSGANTITLTSRLLHKSGEWLEDDFMLPVAKFDPQGIGSALTYARRYAYCAMVGVIADEDDDGNAASQRPSNGQAKATARGSDAYDRVMAPEQIPAIPVGYEDWLTDLQAVADEGTPALVKTWQSSNPDYRRYLTKTNPDLWERIKAKAATIPEVQAAR